MANERERKTFYWVEMSQDLVDIAQSQIEAAARVRVGDLNIISNIVKDAYKERVGENMPADMQELVNRNIAELILFGWGRNTKEKIVTKNVDPIADALFDMSRVLKKQRDFDENRSEDLDIEIWSKDIALPRIKRRIVTSFRREKQLRVFAQ